MKNISNNYNKYIFDAYPEPFVTPLSLLFPSTVFLFVSIFFLFALRCAKTREKVPSLDRNEAKIEKGEVSFSFSQKMENLN